MYWDGMTRVADQIQQHKNNVYGAFMDTTTPSDLDLAGWVAPDFMPTFLKLSVNLTEHATVIEVGTWKGASTNLMANHLKSFLTDFEIVAVDSWLGSVEWYTWGIDDDSRGKALQRKHGYPTVYLTFIKNVILQGNTDHITPFPMSSAQAAQVFSYYHVLADVIYIDGSHEEDAVYSDLQSYWPLLKPDGHIFGDDVNWDGVNRAVHSFATEKQLVLQTDGIIWFIKKT